MSSRNELMLILIFAVPALLALFGTAVPVWGSLISIGIGLGFLVHFIYVIVSRWTGGIRKRREDSRLQSELGLYDFGVESRNQFQEIDRLVGLIDQTLVRFAPKLFSEMKRLPKAKTRGFDPARLQYRKIGKLLEQEIAKIEPITRRLSLTVREYQDGVSMISESTAQDGEVSYSEKDIKEAATVVAASAIRLKTMNMLILVLEEQEKLNLQQEYTQGIKKFVACLRDIQFAMSNIHQAAEEAIASRV